MNGGPDGGLGGADRDAGAVTGSGDAGSGSGACDAGENLPGGTNPPVVTPDIFIDGQPIVLVKKPYTDQARVRRKQVTLVVDDTAFDGSGRFTFTGNAIRFFTERDSGREVSSGDSWAGLELGMGVRLYAEGARPSGGMRDVELVLTLTPGCKRVNPPARERMTSVEVTLDIHKTRTAAATDPVALAEKTTDPGRIVHVQDTSFHHGRALLIIRKALPNDFTGDLVLTRDNDNVRVFDTPHEIAAGQAPLPPAPYTIGNGTVATPAGKRLWAEGANVSGRVGDTGFRLGVSGVHDDGDRVKMTVVQFYDLRAVVGSTPPDPPRLGNGPAADHAAFGGGNAAANYDEDFAVNAPLVLIENSLPAAKSVNLSVGVRPRVPVFWGVERNKFGANRDHANVVALSPRPEPTIAPLRTDSLTATLKLDAVGSFRIRPFVDIDGAGNNEYHDAAGNRIDREPFIIMNLVLVRVQANDNSLSRADANHLTFTPAAPTAAADFRVDSTDVAAGAAWSNAVKSQMGCHNNASATVTGGGPVGRTGLDWVFAAWVNNRLTSPGSTTVPAGPDIVAEYQETPPAPAAGPAPAPIIHRRVEIWDSRNRGTVRVYLPDPPPPAPAGPRPTIEGGPFLDTSWSSAHGAGTGGNTCSGTEGDWGPPVPIDKTDLAVGQTWRVEMWDSPGRYVGASHEGFPGTAANPIPIVSARLNWDFRSDLVFWTNVSGNPAATNHAACRLYATVITNRWNIRVAVTFDIATGAGTIRTRTLSMSKEPARPAAPCEGAGVQVRSPVSLEMNAVDASGRDGRP